MMRMDEIHKYQHQNDFTAAEDKTQSDDLGLFLDSLWSH